jgi:hypothetical protein
MLAPGHARQGNIDTRHDTLDQALAVVALSFESSSKTSTNKVERAAKQAT